MTAAEPVARCVLCGGEAPLDASHTCRIALPLMLLCGRCGWFYYVACGHPCPATN